MSFNIGELAAIQIAQGDIETRCPGCSQPNSKRIGMLTVKGIHRDVRKCESCNRVFAKEDGAIRALVEEAEKIYEAPVGFMTERREKSEYGDTSGNHVPPAVNMFNTEQQLRNVDLTLQNKLNEVVNAIYSLTATVTALTKQNHDLMQKMQADSLINIRKAVSEFNLK